MSQKKKVFCCIRVYSRKYRRSGTKKMAEILREKGAKNVETVDLSRDDMSEAVEDAFHYVKLVVASATYDDKIFPCMEDFLAHLRAKNYQKRKVALMENGMGTDGSETDESDFGRNEKNYNLRSGSDDQIRNE